MKNQYKKQKLERTVSAKVMESDFQVLKKNDINISKLIRDTLSQMAKQYAKPKQGTAS